jgi:hypothetical protein
VDAAKAMGINGILFTTKGKTIDDLNRVLKSGR